MMRRWLSPLLPVLLLACSGNASCDECDVAVAANFAVPAQKIAAQFARETGHQAILSFGSTGKFAAQIRAGAPFDVLLAADQETPTGLGSDALPVTQFTYAIGTLVLWSADPALVDAGGQILHQQRFRHLAIAAPAQAPYGAAAMQTLKALQLADQLAATLVTGESIGQTYTFVATGNAELGFVALSQVSEDGHIKSGSAWIVPESLHAPLRQDAILLKHGATNRAASAFLAYLKSDAARAIMRAYGYHF